jgi:hypothetical protein
MGRSTRGRLSLFFGVQHYWQERFIIFQGAWTHPTAIAGSRLPVLARGHVYQGEPNPATNSPPHPLSSIIARLFRHSGRDFLHPALNFFNGWMYFSQKIVLRFSQLLYPVSLVLQFTKHRLLPRRQPVHPPEANAPARKVQPNGNVPHEAPLTNCLA